MGDDRRCNPPLSPRDPRDPRGARPVSETAPDPLTSSGDSTPPPGAPHPTATGDGASGGGSPPSGGERGGGGGGFGAGGDGGDGGGRFRPGMVVEGRYLLREVIGYGGYGEVFAAEDQRTGRTVAVKIVYHRGRRPVGDEVQRRAVHARLEHPYVLPTFDRYLRPTHTVRVMDEVDGGTLDEVIAALHPELRRPQPAATETHGAGEPGDAGEGEDGGATRPKVAWGWDEAFALLVEAARAVGEVHARGVIHLDLKPDNVMWIRVDRSPRLIDWDLACLYGEVQIDGPERAPVGAWAYMAPERRRGELRGLSPRADVFALGAMLHALLTGWPPVATSEQPPAPEVPADGSDWSPVVAVCLDALSPDPSVRPRDGRAFAEALESAVAARAISAAHGLLATAEARRRAAREAANRRAEARRAAQPWHPMEDHRGYYEALRDELDLLGDAAIYHDRWLRDLRAVIFRSPHLPEPHAALAAWQVEQYFQAIGSGDERGATVLRNQLVASKMWLEQRLPRARSPEPKRVLDAIASALSAEGTLALRVSPVGAQVEQALVDRDVFGMWVEGPFAAIGNAVVDATVSWGRRVLRLTAEGHAPVRLPVLLLPGDCAPRGFDGGPLRVVLPRAGSLGADDVYVPAGWFRAGGGDAGDIVTERRLWLDGFVMKRNPVTHREYIAFLDALWAAGDRASVAVYMAGQRAEFVENAPIEPSYRRDAEGRHHLDRSNTSLDAPVNLVDWACARAYAAWLSAETGQSWRLPSEWEHEKAARGVDGRAYPWGEYAEPCLTNIANSQPDRPGPCSVYAETHDVSVYGVRWLAGNMRNWCLDGWSIDGPPDGSRVDIEALCRAADAPADFRVVRGGAFPSPIRTVHAAARWADRPRWRPTTVGFRLARSFDEGGFDGADAG